MKNYGERGRKTNAIFFCLIHFFVHPFYQIFALKTSVFFDRMIRDKCRSFLYALFHSSRDVMFKGEMWGNEQPRAVVFFFVKSEVRSVFWAKIWNWPSRILAPFPCQVDEHCEKHRAVIHSRVKFYWFLSVWFFAGAQYSLKQACRRLQNLRVELNRHTHDVMRTRCNYSVKGFYDVMGV